jgi:hypothetical protein
MHDGLSVLPVTEDRGHVAVMHCEISALHAGTPFVCYSGSLQSYSHISQLSFIIIGVLLMTTC